MFFSKQTRQAFIKQYGVAVTVALVGHFIIFGSLLFGVIEFKPDVKKFKLPEYTVMNLVELAPPVPAIKPEVKKPDDTKQKQEQKKLEDQKKEAERKKQEDAQKKADAKKKEEAKKQAEAKKIAAQKKEEENKLAEKKRLEAEKKKADAEKKRLEALKKLEAEQEARELAELNNEFANINDELEQELKQIEDEKQRLAQLEKDNQAAFDEQQALSARQKAAQAMAQEQMNIVDTYAFAIKEEVQRNWNKNQASRPYVAVLKIELAPTGELVNVEVVNSNGDKAFNQSLINAVKNVGMYTVPDDPILFETYFRTNNLTFGAQQ
ncbi:cell envelope integrity protein TolA [Marinicellulosiphila megalodicopiae]|uniref:cell envelope integrity protein TolA n=1 Tax=Marinicellulosiphila megalodicopiae TaxID=2724896 RepID=UPI003BAE7DCC